VIYMDPAPIKSFVASIAWLIAVIIVGLLMVSTWRYPSFKKINLSKPRSPLVVLLIGAIALICLWSQPVLLIMAITYVMSGILIRLGGIIRRRRKAHPPPYPPAHLPEHQVG
jgi:CDP-diacylglycerol--serine O-phosphatidyltransferase